MNPFIDISEVPDTTVDYDIAQKLSRVVQVRFFLHKNELKSIRLFGRIHPTAVCLLGKLSTISAVTFIVISEVPVLDMVYASVAQQLKRLQLLDSLSCQNIKIDESLLEALTSEGKLSSLSLWNCGVDARLLKFISTVKGLHRLSLSHDVYTPDELLVLNDSKSLKHLSITDPFFDEFGNCPRGLNFQLRVNGSLKE